MSVIILPLNKIRGDPLHYIFTYIELALSYHERTASEQDSVAAR